MKIFSLFPLTLLFCATLHADDSVLPPPKQGGMYVIAHRGAHNHIPENTLAAYQKAIDLGCDFVEIDVRTTLDGELVSIHNGDIDAYLSNGEKGHVKDFTLTQLKALDIGSHIDAKWKDERIPTFKEILALCKGNICVYLDFKAADPDQVVKIVKEFAMEKNIVWYAAMPILKRVAEICPECIPMPDPPRMALMEKAAEELMPKIFGPSFESLSEEYVQFCHEHKALVFVDAMSQEEWVKAFAVDVDGIQTNFPEDLIEKLKQKK